MKNFPSLQVIEFAVDRVNHYGRKIPFDAPNFDEKNEQLKFDIAQCIARKTIEKKKCSKYCDYGGTIRSMYYFIIW